MCSVKRCCCASALAAVCQQFDEQSSILPSLDALFRKDRSSIKFEDCAPNLTHEYHVVNGVK
jgi:hypothetical protein